MKLLNKITISLIFLPLIAFISCSNKDTTGSNNDNNNNNNENRTLSYYAGNWYGNPDNTGETHIITINTNGSMIIKSERGDITVTSDSITRNSDTNYTTTVNYANGNIQANLTFSSDTQGKFDMISEGTTTSIDIAKK